MGRTVEGQWSFEGGGERPIQRSGGACHRGLRVRGGESEWSSSFIGKSFVSIERKEEVPQAAKSSGN